jgi:hypothetical protein
MHFASTRSNGLDAPRFVAENWIDTSPTQY